MEKINLFPTTVWKSRINPNLYDKEGLIRDVRENYRRDPYRNAWNNDGTLHHCYNDWDNPKFVRYNVDLLMEQYDKLVTEFINTLPSVKPLKYKYVMVNVTANKEGQYMGEHDHIGSSDGFQSVCSYSCCHYVKLEPHQPSTTFINPLMVGQYATTLDFISSNMDKNNTDNTVYHQSWEIPTQEDDIVIFPSYIKHKVRGNWRQKDSNELRITAVVNIDIYKDQS